MHSKKLYNFFITGYLIFQLSTNSWDIDVYSIDQLRGNCTEFSRSMTTLCVLAFFCSSFSFNDLWLFMVYRRFALTPTNQKNTFVWKTLISVLCHVSPKIRVFVLLVCSKLDWHARHFGVHYNMIQSLLRRFRQSGNTRDRQRSGRLRVMSRQQHNHIRLVHLRDRFQTSSLTARSIPGLPSLSSRTVRNILRGHHIRPRHPAIRPIFRHRHRAARLTWCRRHLRFRNRIGPISCHLFICP